MMSECQGWKVWKLVFSVPLQCQAGPCCIRKSAFCGGLGLSQSIAAAAASCWVAVEQAQSEVPLGDFTVTVQRMPGCTGGPYVEAYLQFAFPSVQPVIAPDMKYGMLH